MSPRIPGISQRHTFRSRNCGPGSCPLIVSQIPTVAIAPAKRHHVIVQASSSIRATLSAIGSTPHKIAVVSAKFAHFLAAPEWSFWKLLWFSNKVFVLLYFVGLVAILALRRRHDFDDARRPRWTATA